MAGDLFELRAEINFAYWRGLPEEVRHAIKEKTIDQTLVLYNKVKENVEGKILHTKSGELADSIQIRVREEGNAVVGFVGPEPATKKAWALEYGGKSYYDIYPSKALLLHFYWEKLGQEVWLEHVDHPPMREFAYLRSALADMNVEAGYTEAVDNALRKGL